MTDTQEIAEDLLSELRELECVRGETSHLLEWPDALELLTAYGTAQFKAGQEDMRERAKALAQQWEDEYKAERDRTQIPEATQAYKHAATACGRLSISIAALPVKEK